MAKALEVIPFRNYSDSMWQKAGMFDFKVAASSHHVLFNAEHIMKHKKIPVCFVHKFCIMLISICKLQRHNNPNYSAIVTYPTMVCCLFIFFFKFQAYFCQNVASS